MERGIHLLIDASADCGALTSVDDQMIENLKPERDKIPAKG
jgi:hypothetical protein